MAWKKINSVVQMFEKPCLGQVKPKQGERFMALCVEPESRRPYRGLAREITRSEGNPDIPGFIDESKLIIVESEDLLYWKKVSNLKIKNIERLIKKLSGDDKYFIGLEDPDIIKKNNLHIYFTIAFKYKEKVGYAVYLGHAEGKTLETLTATKPVLSPLDNFRGFKEACFSELTYNNVRINLSEAQMVIDDDDFSMTVSSKVKDIGKAWKYQKIVIDPRKIAASWCNGETSPCRFISKKLISLENEDLLVGIMNGREPKKILDGKKVYGIFRPGLFIFNARTGEIPWVAPKPLFKDPAATTITFASEVIPFNEKHLLLYAHVNDSFVRAYKLNTQELKKLLPKN